MVAKFALIALGFCLTNALYIDRENHPYAYLVEEANILEDNFEDQLSEREVPYLSRERRQIGSLSSNPDGSMNINAKIPLAGNDKNILSAVGSGSGINGGAYKAAGGGFALDNVNGHGLSLTGTHIPKFGDQLTAAAKLNLANTQDHNLNANAFLTRTMPNNPNIPNFNTHGASVDYLFKNKVGASLGVAQTPLFQKTDYSAMGNLNLFRSPTSTLDFNAGVSKSVSPFIPKTSWQPSGGLTFSRFF